MSRVNLLPAEYRRQRANRAAARRIRLFGLYAILLLGGIYGVRVWEVQQLRGDLADVRTQQALVEGQIASFAEVAAQRDSVVVGRQVVASLATGEVEWSRQMVEIARSVPPGFAVTSISATSSDLGFGLVGNMTFSATSPGFPATESWLLRLAAEEYWANPWLSSASGDGTGSTLTISGSVDLTASALSERGGRP
ncbi:MAG: PilN domain-containing protein [Actinomycetota bacterium]